MRVAFVHAPNPEFADTQMFGVHLMPVWVYTLAAHCADLPDITMALWDLRFDALADVADADVFCLSGLNQDQESLLGTLATLRARYPHARFLVGGPICWSLHTAGTLAPLLAFDHVVIGDGEATLPALLVDLQQGRTVPPVIEVGARYPLDKARPMYAPLVRSSLHRYYGAVVEVSRGCPFLCEFCDIRVMPDNNRAHVKPVGLIVEEIETLHALGARQILLACDNLVGDLRWAESLCDAIIDWRTRTGHGVSFHTWLTVNVSRHPRLLAKLRTAGFDMVFIGVESFSQSSLLETAKVQNTATELVPALRTIQSYGLVVVAGLILGFDTDPPDVVDHTLDGLRSSGLISGDPSLLAALPGTPLYRRMQLAGRLRDNKLGLGGFKYRTNLRYLKPATRVRDDFRRLVAGLNDGDYQLERLARFYDVLSSPQFVPSATAGYADVRRLLRLLGRNPRALRLLAARAAALFGTPARVRTILRAIRLTWQRSEPTRPLWFYFKFWAISWSNTLIKYRALPDEIFDVEAVAEGASAEQVLPLAYTEIARTLADTAQNRAQRRVTVNALREFLQPGSATARDTTDHDTP